MVSGILNFQVEESKAPRGQGHSAESNTARWWQGWKSHPHRSCSRTGVFSGPGGLAMSLTDGKVGTGLETPTEARGL